MSSSDVPAPPDPARFLADEIILYGVKLNQGKTEGSIPFGSNELVLGLRATGTAQPLAAADVAITVIYACAYEGHCYRLDKPKLLVFEPEVPDVDAHGCGFAPPYRMWRVARRTELMEMSTSSGRAEKLILEANLPGSRAPNTYGNDMQLAHRAGRLSRFGGSE